jgi:ABC-2 type transport system ATP-binding protein
MPVIEVEGLSKSFRTYKKRPGLRGALRGLFRRDYETTHAVQDIRFSVEEGELVGFLGPNGAGKTTTLKMLAGLLYPSGGTARVLGHVPWERADAYRRQFALLLGQKNQLWWDLPARESLELNARIYGIPRPAFEATVDELTGLLDVRDKLNVMVRELSLGERMKMELIAALLHQPRVLFLDEPTIGLDLPNRRKIWRFIESLRARTGMTVLLTTHYLEEADGCDRVAFIRDGRMVTSGPPRRLIERLGRHIVEIEGADPEALASALAPHLGDSLRDGDTLQFRHEAEDVGRLAGLQSEFGERVSALRWRRPNLNDVFLWVAEGKLR